MADWRFKKIKNYRDYIHIVHNENKKELIEHHGQCWERILISSLGQAPHGLYYGSQLIFAFNFHEHTAFGVMTKFVKGKELGFLTVCIKYKYFFTKGKTYTNIVNKKSRSIVRWLDLMGARFYNYDKENYLYELGNDVN